MRTIDSTAVVAAVRGNLDELARVDVSLLPDACVREELVQLLRAFHQIGAQICARVAAFDARGLAEVDGCRDVKAFLCAFARLSPPAVRPMLARGRMLRQMPQLADAAARGEVSAEHLKPILDLVDDLDLSTVARADAVLAEIAAAGTVSDVATACRRIREHVDPDGPEPDPDATHDQRFLSLTRRANHVDIKGALDLEAGAAVITALDALMRPPTPEDQRTPTQRRADALAELALGALHHGQLPEVHGERPHLGLLITPKALSSQPTTLSLADRAQAFDAWLNAHQRRATRLPPAAPGDTASALGNAWPAHPGRAPTAPPPAAVPRTGSSAAGAPPTGAPPTGAPPAGAPPAGAPPAGAPPTGAPPTGSPPAAPQPTGPPTRPLSAAAVCGECGSDKPDAADAAWLNWVGEIPIELAQRIACDATVWRAVLDPTTSLPLDVGRAYRSAPYWMRRALHARDRGCRFPGCTAAPQWTDAHHLDHWIHGGHTTVSRLLLLCRHHHRLVHEGRWRIEFHPTTAQVRVWRPDGKPYELQPTQAWTGPTTQRLA